MPWNGQSPWEYSRDKQAELKRYRDTQNKHANTIVTVIKFASPVACIFVLYPLFMVITNYAALISMGLAIIAAYILVKALTKYFTNRSSEKIKYEESRIEKAIAANQAEFDRHNAAEAQKAEAERKQREAIAEAERRKKEEEDNARMREWEKAFREKIQHEELAADERMSQSALVHEIAQCILPTFKQIVEKVDTEAHMKVRVRLALEVRADTIDYYDAADPQNRSRFVFKEEGIAEKLSPILRKALCKALVTELRLLILEAFPIDPERKMVQADLEGSVVLKSNVTYVPGRDYTAPEYDANSHAYAVILYQASKDKGERHF